MRANEEADKLTKEKEEQVVTGRTRGEYAQGKAKGDGRGKSTNRGIEGACYKGLTDSKEKPKKELRRNRAKTLKEIRDVN